MDNLNETFDMDSSNTILHINDQIEKAFINRLSIVCFIVVALLAALCFEYFSLFATYLASSVMFVITFFLNKKSDRLKRGKWFIFVNTYVTALITILLFGSQVLAIYAWLLVVMLTAASLRDSLITPLSAVLVGVTYIALILGVNTDFLTDLKIIDASENVINIHLLLQVLFSGFVLINFGQIRNSYANRLEKFAIKLNELNEELTKTKQDADIANNIKTMFLSNMSHEIRTPLNGLNGMLNLLNDYEGLDDRARHFVSIALESNQRLLDQANDLLDMSRLQANAMKLNLSDIDLAETLDPVRKKYEQLAKAKNLEFTWDEQLSLPWVRGDGNRIVSVISHICDNAIKYTRSGRVSVHVSIMRINDRELELEILINDTGIGFDAQKLEYYTKPFTQADMSYSREFEGAGLGLALVHQLLILMKGHFDVQSDLDRGTQCTIKIPVDLPVEFHELKQAEKLKTIEKIQINIEKPQLLIVEDDDNNIRLLKMLMRDYDVQIHSANNGQEALDLLAKLDRCDLMCIDMYMPKMNGLETMHILRQNPRYKKLPVILISGSNDSELIEQWHKFGVTEMLFKPISTSKFDELMQKHFAEAMLD